MQRTTWFSDGYGIRAFFDGGEKLWLMRKIFYADMKVLTDSHHFQLSKTTFVFLSYGHSIYSSQRDVREFNIHDVVVCASCEW